MLRSAIRWLVFGAVFSGWVSVHAQSPDRIRPYEKNARYWQYAGEPVLLLGGSKDDNLFQIPDLEQHLDAMRQVGANYIRNVMSARDEEAVRPFQRLDNGRYDLTQWNPEYWRRFERMLKLTAERDIIVQIELWDQHDHNEDKWDRSPWNPDQNINYAASEVTLKGDGHYHDVQYNSGVRHGLFLTVPGARNDETVLGHQKRFVNKVLEHAFEYDHVLYTITNELFEQHPAAWPRYWARHLRKRAVQAGKRIEITEMFQLVNVTVPQHRVVLDDPELFSYVELSQNAGQTGQTHWDRLQWARRYIADEPRPINHTKIYGSDAVGWTDGTEAGIDRFWRNVIGGAASARFHRPDSGIGLSQRAKQNIRSARLLAKKFNLFEAEPDADSSHLKDRSANEAYLSRVPGKTWAVFFPGGGSVRFDARKVNGSLQLRWLDIERSEWGEPESRQGGRWLPLETPDDGRWVALISRQ